MIVKEINIFIFFIITSYKYKVYSNDTRAMHIMMIHAHMTYGYLSGVWRFQEIEVFSRSDKYRLSLYAYSVTDSR